MQSAISESLHSLLEGLMAYKYARSEPARMYNAEPRVWDPGLHSSQSINPVARQVTVSMYRYLKQQPPSAGQLVAIE